MTTEPAPHPFDLPSPVAALRDEAGEVADRFADRHREVRLSGLEHGALHPELWGEVCERGWPGLLLPEDWGGSGAGLLPYAVVLEELAARNLVLWVPVLDAAIAHAIAVTGPDAARERWLEPVAAGRAHLALAVTEPEAGHNVFRSRTTVRRDGDGFVVDGVKAVSSAVDLADRVLVFGRSGEADGRATFTSVLVDPGAEGLTRTELPMRGREGVRQFRLDFDGVRAPADALVGTEDQGLLALWPSTHIERVLLAALACGNARYCIDLALGEARERNVFGKAPIGAQQAIAHPLAHLHARLAAVQLLVHRTAARFDAGVDGFVVAGEANMAKVLSADLAFDAADQAMHVLGARAWDERAGLMDAYLDARLARSAPVSQELALDFIAQHLLGLRTVR